MDIIFAGGLLIVLALAGCSDSAGTAKTGTLDASNVLPSTPPENDSNNNSLPNTPNGDGAGNLTEQQRLNQFNEALHWRLS